MNPVPVTVPVTNPVPVNLYAVDVPPRDSTSAEQQKQCQIIVRWVDEHGKGYYRQPVVDIFEHGTGLLEKLTSLSPPERWQQVFIHASQMAPQFQLDEYGDPINDTVADDSYNWLTIRCGGKVYDQTGMWTLPAFPASVEQFCNTCVALKQCLQRIQQGRIVQVKIQLEVHERPPEDWEKPVNMVFNRQPTRFT